MGSMYCFICNECGSKIRLSEGIGFMFPQQYEEVIEEIKKGSCGDEYKEFFEQNLEAAVNINKDIYFCKKCEFPFSDINMGLYLPKEPDTKIDASIVPWTVCAPQLGRKYVTPRELTELYRSVKRVSHKCPNCGKVGNRVKNIEKIKPKCQKCGSRSLLLEFGFWD